jgi:hypothetical protein
VAGPFERLVNGVSRTSISSDSKNYLTPYVASSSAGVPNTGNGNFELGSTTGWSLGTIGTLTNGIPTGSPTFGSGASGNLSISVVSSGQISGLYSLSYASSAATTQGNMLASAAFAIDTEDQAKVMTWKFYYSVPIGASTANFSGTSSNSFGVAIYDVTNSVWLSSTSNFGMTQSSGVGYATGTCQTGSTTASIRFVVYNVNATSGAITLYFDDFSFGPQTAPFGPSITDWQAYTPTLVGFGTPVNNRAHWRRVGDSLEVIGRFQAGTTTATTATISLPNSYNIDTTKIDTLAQALCYGQFYRATTAVTATPGTTVGPWIVTDSYTTATNVMYLASNTEISANGFELTTGSALLSTGDYGEFSFKVPIAGWSSNLQMSSDTDTRVVAMQVAQTTPTATVTSTASLVKFTSTPSQDTHGGYSTSTGMYTVPVTGYYQVNIALSLTATFSAGQNAGAYINVNGTSVLSGFEWAGGAQAGISPNISATVYCTAGTTIAPYVSCSGGTPVIGSAITCYFQVQRLSGPSIIAATESVNGKYVNSSSAITTSFGTVIYSTKVYDTHNAYNASTGTLTVPVSGKYQFYATLLIQASSGVHTPGMQITQNGTATAQRYGQFDTPVNVGSDTLVSDLVACSAGDVILVQAIDTATGGSISSGTLRNTFWWTRVGN